MRVLVLVALTAWFGLSAAEVDSDAAHARVLDLMAALPAPPAVTPSPVEALTGDVPMIDGVLITPGQRVVLQGVSLFDQGPVDGLEVLCCLEGGKNHEAFARLLSGNAKLVKAAFIAALDLDADGTAVPAQEMSSVPARGIPLAVDLVWRPDLLLAPDTWVRAPASALVRDRGTDRAYPALPWIYTGSRFSSFDQRLPGSDEVKRVERFMLGVTLSVAVNFDEPDALLASPFPTAAQDDSFEVNSAMAPPTGSDVAFVFRRAELPLTLALAADGALSADGGAVLDDATLGEALATAYPMDADVQLLRAVAVAAPPGAVGDAAVVACRDRIMRLAAERGVWVIPVFTP